MMDLKSKPANFQENIILANQATFKIGGPARYFLLAEKKEEVIKAISWAKENDLPFFILGGGSNILFSDRGFDGLVIKIKDESLEIDVKAREIKAGAGVALADIVSQSINLGWSGMEWALGIPGTLGGAVCGNAGRLGLDTSRVVKSVSILGPDLAEKEILAQDCDFSYRSSRFKKQSEIIFSAVLKFFPQNKEETENLLRQAQAVIDKMPDQPCAGSVFKNYLVGENDSLINSHPEFKEKVNGGKLAAGFLIQQCGLLGNQIGGAQIWPQHANFILNIGQAKAQDVLGLIELVKKTVKEKFNVNLEEEIRKIGF